MINEFENIVPPDATALDAEELDGLIPGLSTRLELNAFEQANIARAVVWSRASRKLKHEPFTIESVRLLHRKMFDETWTWAGKFRTSGKNLGVEPYLIQEQLACLCSDGIYWLDKQVYPIQECAVRFHHRLVSIHPFPNGNGRHARLFADVLLFHAKQPALKWGGRVLDVEGDTRAKYLEALRQADDGKYAKLLKFAMGG